MNTIVDDKDLSQMIKIVLDFAEEEEKKGNRNIQNLTNKFSLMHYLRMAEEINSYLEGGAKVLDWGCGYGHMAFFISRLRIKTIPCDIHQETLSFYKKMNMKNFIVLPPTCFPFKDDSFEAVLSCGVLEHVIDEQKSLDELQRIIKKQGYLFIYMLPAKYGLYETFNTLIGKSDHPIKYTCMSIKKILKKKGFKIIAIKKSNLLPKYIPLFFPLFIRRIFKKMYDENPTFFLSVESFLLKIPIINFFAGTIEIIARKA